MSRRSARAAGLGRAPRCPIRIGICIGMPIATCWSSARGPAGLAAALAASATGARVILCDEQAELGGSLLAETECTHRWLNRRRTGCRRRSRRCARVDVTLLPRTTAFGWYPGQHDRSGGTRHRSSRRSPIRRCRANGCGRCGRSGSSSPPARSSGRWCFPATTGPASCWRMPRGRICTATASRSATRVVIATADDSAYRGRGRDCMRPA